MIEELQNNVLLISHGDWYIRMGNLYLGHTRLEMYREMGYKVNWIWNAKIRLYVHVKMIKGDSWSKAVNRVLDKVHLNDLDYRDIEKE